MSLEYLPSLNSYTLNQFQYLPFTFPLSIHSIPVEHATQRGRKMASVTEVHRKSFGIQFLSDSAKFRLKASGIRRSMCLSTPEGLALTLADNVKIALAVYSNPPYILSAHCNSIPLSFC